MKCSFCTADLGSGPAIHLCSRCGAPQPLRPDETFFGVFGFERPVFQFSPVEVEGLFYRISRSLHPDRFAAQGQESWRRNSLDRMSFLNEALRTLKNREALRSYVLRLEGVHAGDSSNALTRKAALPLDLAEEWFELQEKVLEGGPAEVGAGLEAFERQVFARMEQFEHAARLCEMEFDRSSEPEAKKQALVSLSGKIQDLQYLRSLYRDVGRLRDTAAGVA